MYRFALLGHSQLKYWAFSQLVFFISMGCWNILTPWWEDDQEDPWVHWEGVKEIYEMRWHLKIFMNKVLFDQQPVKTQTDNTSLQHLTCACTWIELQLNCMSRIDNANIQMKTDERRKVYKAGSFFYRPHSKQENTSMEVPVWSENEREEGDHCKLKH